MRNILIIFILFLASCTQNSAEVGHIQRSFEAYRAAISKNDGAEAARLVSRNSLDNYDRLRKLALYAEKEDLMTEGLLDRYLILRFRLEFRTHQLKSMSGRNIFENVTDKGWSGQDTETTTLSKIKIKGNTATARALQAGKKTDWIFEFVKEDAIWKLDISAMTPTLNKAMHVSRTNMAASEETYLDFLLPVKDVSQRRFDTRWEPKAKRE